MKTRCLFMFKEFGPIPGMELPSMKDYMNHSPYPEKEKIVRYLKMGKKTYCATSCAHDCFSGETIVGEQCGMTDGKYSWNNELIHYVEKYNLRLPDDFVEYVMKN